MLSHVITNLGAFNRIFFENAMLLMYEERLYKRHILEAIHKLKIFESVIIFCLLMEMWKLVNKQRKQIYIVCQELTFIFVLTHCYLPSTNASVCCSKYTVAFSEGMLWCTCEVEQLQQVNVSECMCCM